MARPSKEEVQKREAAKKRVDELFGGSVKVDIKNVTNVADKINELQSESGNDWLQSQVTVLSDKNKELENEVITARENYTKLLDSKGGVGAPTATNSTPVNDSDLKRGIRKIFDDLRNNYEGKNQNQTKYEDAKIKVLLEQFLRTFPFLVEGMSPKR